MDRNWSYKFQFLQLKKTYVENEEIRWLFLSRSLLELNRGIDSNLYFKKKFQKLRKLK
jgi:hypothetical protein